MLAYVSFLFYYYFSRDIKLSIYCSLVKLQEINFQSCKVKIKQMHTENYFSNRNFIAAYFDRVI